MRVCEHLYLYYVSLKKNKRKSLSVTSPYGRCMHACQTAPPDWSLPNACSSELVFDAKNLVFKIKIYIVFTAASIASS